MPTVELIYDADCPNVKEARSQLLRAFTKVSLPPTWKEWERNSKESPTYARQFGSPTILIDGRDCTGLGPSSEAGSCRIYRNATGATSGIPPLESIASALVSGAAVPSGEGERRGLISHAAVLTSIGVALLPKLVCPACWPDYAGVLSAVGLGFLVNSRYLFALTAVFLVAQVFFQLKLSA